MIICNNEESEQVCKIMNEFDKHRSVYVKINHIEFTKQKVSRRSYVGRNDYRFGPMSQIETNCIKVNGQDIIAKGTRYIYEGDKLYTEICRWYDNRLQKRRNEKLENIGI